MKTYPLLERIADELAAVPPDAAARYSYCWTQAGELAEALLDDIEAVIQLRGYMQDIRLLLYPKWRFSTGEFWFGLHFDPQDQFSMLCSCRIGERQSVQLKVLNEADGRDLQRVAKLLSGLEYDNSWVELKTLN